MNISLCVYIEEVSSRSLPLFWGVRPSGVEILHGLRARRHRNPALRARFVGAMLVVDKARKEEKREGARR